MNVPTRVETLHILDREAVDSNGRVLLLGDSHYVSIVTTKGIHRFEVTAGGWLKLHAELSDPAAQLIREALSSYGEPALLDGGFKATMRSRAIGVVTSQITRVSDESWAAMATSYKAEGVITQSNRVSAGMLLAVSTFGSSSIEESPEVFLGVVKGILIYPA